MISYDVIGCNQESKEISKYQMHMLVLRSRMEFEIPIVNE